MAEIWMDVDTALAEVPVNVMPLIDDGDFKTVEDAVAYNASGMDLRWNFVTTAGAYTSTAVTPTTGGDYDWTHQGDGMYTLEIPASGGASINNDTEGFGWFSGKATGVLPWRGPVIGFRAAALNNLLIDDAPNAHRGLAGTALPNAAAEAAGGLYTRGTGAGQINQDADGRIDVNTKTQNGTALTARDIGASVLLSSGTGTGQVSLSSGAVTVGTNNDKTGYSLSSGDKNTLIGMIEAGKLNTIYEYMVGYAGLAEVVSIVDNGSGTPTFDSNGNSVVWDDGPVIATPATGWTTDHDGLSSTATFTCDTIGPQNTELASGPGIVYVDIPGRAPILSMYEGVMTTLIGGVSTLLSRVTAAVYGYWQNLNVGGAVASQADIAALNQSASRRVLLSTPGQYERPESGSSLMWIEARTYSRDGAAMNATGTPTLAATGIVSGNLAANLSSAANPATGVYRWEYTVDDEAVLENVRFDFSATVDGDTVTMSALAVVCDFVSATFTTGDRDKITAVYNKLPSKSHLAGSNNADGDIQLDEATGAINSASVTAIQSGLASQASVDDIPTNSEFSTALADIKGATFDTSTDSLEALRNRGDAAWVTGSTPPTASAIADAVWDEATSDHQTSGTTGKALTDAQSAGDPWSTSVPGSYTAGQAGYVLGNMSGGGASVEDIVDGILDETLAELTVGEAPATPQVRQLLMLLYMALRNASEADQSKRTVRNNAGTAILEGTFTRPHRGLNQGKLGTPS